MTQPHTGARDEFDLTGKSAVVTGGSRGIGRAIALAFAARGASVLVVARSAEGLGETVRLGSADGGRVEPFTADLRDGDSIEAAIVHAVDTFGGLDILVNNAGDYHVASIEKTTLPDWKRVVDLGLQSCFQACQIASPHLAADGGGKVINIASVLGTIAVRDSSAYVSAKHGIIGLTRALALEWARRNVQVNALAPGFVETQMLADEMKDDAIAAWIKGKVPMGRWAQPEEMGGPAVFLASSASDFMTGQVLIVDGGQAAQ